MKTKRLSSQGFSLLELVLVLAIVGVLVGLLLPKGFEALRNSRVQEARTTINTLRSAIADLITMPGGNGSVPRTEGTSIPCVGTALSAATDTAKGNAARLDTVLLAIGKLERPLSLRMGSQAYASSGSGNEISWDTTNQAFAMTPDTAPLRNWSSVTRIEARTANPALSPAAAQGANFRLDGTTNRSANVTIAYLVIVGVPAADAYQLALSLNGPQMTPALGLACDVGQVAYAAPVNGFTDVFCYLTEI